MSLAARLAAAPAVAAARTALRDGPRAWIVGGAVRDAALDRAVGDLDLAVDGDPSLAARRIAELADAHAFELSSEFSTWRVVERGGMAGRSI